MCVCSRARGRVDNTPRRPAPQGPQLSNFLSLCCFLSYSFLLSGFPFSHLFSSFHTSDPINQQPPQTFLLSPLYTARTKLDLCEARLAFLCRDLQEEGQELLSNAFTLSAWSPAQLTTHQPPNTHTPVWVCWVIKLDTQSLLICFDLSLACL